MTTGKSLTQPPTNLKEAIDWVLRVSGRDNGDDGNEAIKILAKELIKLLDKDAAEVARGVLGVMGGTFDKVVGGLDSLKSQQTYVRSPVAFIQTFKGKTELVRDYGSAVDDGRIGELIDLLQKDVDGKGEGHVCKLADGLQEFIGWNGTTVGNDGIGKTGQYKSSYKKEATWNSLNGKDADKETCALIFLGIFPMLFYTLPFLYWICSDGTPRWKGDKLTSGSLQIFMEKMGFKTDLDDWKNGSAVASLIGNTCFPEIKTAYNAAKTEKANTEPYYATVIKHLEQSATSKPSPHLTLSRCHIIASTFFTPNPTHRVQSTSPATPSFHGYSGLSALADSPSSASVDLSFGQSVQPEGGHRLDPEGDGKDGGGSQEAIKALTEQVKELFREVKGVDHNLGAEIAQVRKAFDDGKLIGKLAEGLQQFIGYDGTSFISGNVGKITGAGIAPSNIATHRLCDAAIAFTIGVLEGCKRHSDLKNKGNQRYLESVNNALQQLYDKYGSGTAGLQEVAGSVANNLNEVKGSNVKSFLVDIGTAFQTLGSAIQSQTRPTDVAQKVGEYLQGVFNKWTTNNGHNIGQKLTNLGKKLQSPNTAYDPNNSDVKNKINDVNSTIGTINPKTGIVQPILTSGKNAFMETLKKKNYESRYQGYKTNTHNVTICAKIFLGCLPLYYQALTYIYWGCHENGGGWNAMTLGGGALRSYFDSQGLLSPHVDTNKRGAHIADSALKKFSEFQQGMSEAQSSSSYASFTKELMKKVEQNSGDEQGISSTCPLSALFYGASCYFRYQQMSTAKSAGGAPKTIREMLYFLAALQFSPQYDAFDGYVTSHFKTLTGSPSSDDSELKLQVEDSNIPSKRSSGGDDTLSATQLKEYLRASCAFSSSVLGLIQGPGASEHNSDPWLFELFCNSAFQFRYPTGASLFSKVSSYAYALQFQLIFLYSMCGNIGLKCGWQECTYGKEMNPKASHNSLQSHICQGFKCSEPSSCNHNSGQCNHNNYSDNAGCGKGSNGSPLQAFITDNLKGFCLQHPGSSNHLDNHPPGKMCHIKMGFNAESLRSIGNGAVVYSVLKPICGNFSSPLRQLCEKLGCLTKRTPRSLGDLFGFTWHLKGQLSTTLSGLKSAQWLKDLAGYTPFSNNLIQNHGQKLQTFVGTDHQAHGNSPADLTALHSSGCKEKEKTCGPYLSPLTLSNGATFGKPAPYASTYLSWMVYLTDDIETGFQELLDEFKNIDCSKTGCRGKAGGHKCDKVHPPGTHGTSDECSCDSVVHCGGVLPLLYRYGFTFGSTGDLFGEVTNGTNTKRNCKAFVKQLQSVITGKPLQDLFESIDSFLYLFRFYFLYNLSSFWSIYICLILYTFFFLLDTLHLRSHLKVTTSHTVPPLNLLTSGTPLPITKLTYIGH
ncbi:variant erythrocyte surface antigen-1 family protein [Babesia caballi]|uniref:Variant erythrocyte surface antigen-1 family protein n=1 Tax=Babesia caballi TaxID=5871 RepID=A0AAV4LQV7_BABCB|nr:variant erythrocyte surface antigen-1 family protein [Babesia caballi]